jgi:hypothetical protein
MATLAPLTKAPVLDQDGEMLGADGRNTHNVVSSDPAVADVQWLDWRPGAGRDHDHRYPLRGRRHGNARAGSGRAGPSPFRHQPRGCGARLTPC